MSYTEIDALFCNNSTVCHVWPKSYQKRNHTFCAFNGAFSPYKDYSLWFPFQGNSRDITQQKHSPSNDFSLKIIIRYIYFQGKTAAGVEILRRGYYLKKYNKVYINSGHILPHTIISAVKMICQVKSS